MTGAIVCDHALCGLSAVEIASKVRSGDVSAEEVTRAHLEAIEALNPAIGAYVGAEGESAMAAAVGIDRAHEAGESLGPLAGVPIALKDNLCTSAGVTSCGSRFLDGYCSPYDATAVRGLVASGAVVLGKSAMDEFAMGSSCEHCAFGATRNPRDLSRVPGGSSGGSAAAVAANLTPLALGSDTGGSIRQPAAYCGVVGLKPTYGRVSRYGLVAYASSLDQIGPITRTVEDAAVALGAIAGVDPHDSTSADLPTEDFGRDLSKGVAGMRIGLAEDCLSGDNEASVNASVRSAADRLASCGAEIVPVALANLRYAISAYYIVAPAEASSNLARFDGIRYGRRAAIGADEGLIDLYEKSRSEGFGAEVQRRIMLGTYVLSAGYYDAYYVRALKVRRLIKRDFDVLFEGESASLGGRGVEAVLMPTTPGPAFERGAIQDPLTMYLQDVYTIPANMAGLPAISVPFGASNGVAALPIGVQLVGKAFDEATLLRVAAALEE